MVKLGRITSVFNTSAWKVLMVNWGLTVNSNKEKTGMLSQAKLLNDNKMIKIINLEMYLIIISR